MLTQAAVNFTCFEKLSDPRRTSGNYQHNLFDIVFLALCGTICFCETWEDIEDFGNERIDWLRQYITLDHGVPGHDTIARVISRLDTATFFECLQQWTDGLYYDLRGKGIHLDGKTARRSFDHDSNLAAMHMVSAWVDELSLCIGQVATDQKSNEITAIPLLLEMLDIKGAVVTLDAMGCQVKIVNQIVAQQADYIISVKRNQPTLHDAIEDQFTKSLNAETKDRRVRSKATKRQSRGRLTKTTVTVAPVPESIKTMNKWDNIQSIVRVDRHRQPVNPDNPKAIKETHHVTYFISSLAPKANLIASHMSKHWTIENSLHWTLDVTFTDDHSRIRKGSAPAIMGSIKRFVLSLLKRDTSMPKTSLKRKRLRSAMNPGHIKAILFGV